MTAPIRRRGEDDRRPDGIGVPSRYHIHGAEGGGLDLFCADLSIAEG